MPAMSLLLMLCVSTFALEPAGTTADRATRVMDTTSLALQSGGNFLRFEVNHLPATVMYLPDSAFGPIPSAMLMDEELTPTVFFSDCRMGWKWVIGASETVKIMEIKAHENASVRVEPTILYTESTVEEEACDSFLVGDRKFIASGNYILDTTVLDNGDRQVNHLALTIRYSTSYEQTIKSYEPYKQGEKEYAVSGDYRDTVTNVAGCDSIIITHFTLLNTTYDSFDKTECDQFTYHDKTYTRSGEYKDTVVAESGDRTITTINLTINNSSYAFVEVTSKDYYISDQGVTYTESGEYKEIITNVAGCDSIITLRVTIIVDKVIYDTVYFCKGFNTEHDERVSDELVLRYRAYTFESPAQNWDSFMEGVEIGYEQNKTIMDLQRAEANMRNHFTGPLTPIESISWSVRYAGSGKYEPIAVEAQPQKIGDGVLAVLIRFRCGEVYSNAYPLAITETEASAERPVKRIENGQLYIMYKGTKYDVQGRRVN